MEDTAKVIIDYFSAKEKERDQIDTGLWKLIHKGSFIETNTAPVGLNLVCEGVKYSPTQDDL